MTDKPDAALPAPSAWQDIEALRDFLEAIIAAYGANDHAWLVRCAKDNLATLPAPPQETSP